MLDIKFVRDNPEAVKENIRKKFQNAKLPLVDEVIALDAEKRAAMNEANDLRAQRNQLSKRVGMLMGQAKKDPSKLAEAEEAKAQVKANADRLAQLEEMLQAEGPIGRKLDFLIQEFNREANTIGSKCTDVTVARIVVDIKAELEKIREQVQNVE